MKQFIAKMIVASIACLSDVAQAAEFDEDKDSVIILTDANFQKEVQKNQFLLTFIHAPWCGHCNTLAPEIKAAAAHLKEFKRPIGVMNGDARTADATMKELKVESFPAMFWWVGGVQEPYNKDNDRASIIKFVKQQSGLEATSDTHSEELQCDQILKVSKAHKHASFMFGSQTSMFFNFFQEMQKQMRANRKQSGEDVDMLLGKMLNDGTEDIEEPHIKLPRFKYFHSKSECITQFFKDGKVEQGQGAMVVISPGNIPEKIEDSKSQLGFDPKTMARFMQRFTEPAFQRVTRFNNLQVLQPDRKIKENKQVTFLISRNAEAELGFKAMGEAAIKQKYYMNYYYVSNTRPTRKQTRLADQAQDRSKAYKEKLMQEIRDVSAQEKKGGAMTAERKEHNDKIEKETKRLDALAKVDGYKYTPEELDAVALVEEEKIFQYFMKNFHLNADKLPVIYQYDPQGAADPPMYSPLDINQRDITVEKLVKESELFIGQWKKPVDHSEPLPPADGWGLAHRQIVGYNYEEIASNPNGEALINHAVDNEPFCKILAPEFIKLAEVLKEVKGLTLGTFDPTKNRVGFVNHYTYPSIVHFTKTNKRGRKIKFVNRKGKQIESFIKYLSKHSDAYKAHMEANPKFDPIAKAKKIVLQTMEELKAQREKDDAIAKEKAEADALAAKKKAKADKKAGKGKAKAEAEKNKDDDVVDLDEEPQKVEKKEEKKTVKKEKKADEKKADL